MSTIDVKAAWDAVRARLVAAAESGTVTVPLRFQGETGDPIPDETAFAFVTMTVFDQYVAANGGGRGQTRNRNPFLIVVYVCVPKGWGLSDGFRVAEPIAALFRNKTFGGVSCFGAACDPNALLGEGHSELAGNYDVTAVTVSARFDQTG